MELTDHEQQWLAARRALQRRVFVGIDHHAAQFTVAVAGGDQLQQRPEPERLEVVRFAQDGPGYEAFLAWFRTRYPDTAPADVWLLSEPSYSQPLRYFLHAAGFHADQILWVKTTKAAQFRKAHDLSRSGKNDDADARTLVLLLYDALAAPGSRVQVFPVADPMPGYEALRQLSAEYARLTGQSVQLQNKIFHLVLRLFPEYRRVFARQVRQRKPDGTEYAVHQLDLFENATPLRLLRAFPTPRLLAAAGFEKAWQQVGGRGVRKAAVRRLVELAACSAGVPDALAERRLVLLIDEYLELQARLREYRGLMRQAVEEDPVLASLLRIPCVTEVMLAGLVGEVGDLERCATADQLKQYLGLAPRPMPHSGQVDDQGRVVQWWRMPANTYRVVQGQRQLVYRAPGKHRPRVLAWLWFDQLRRGRAQYPDDPFVRYYLACKARLEGQPRWLGRTRWKVVGKLARVIFACLKYCRPYDPAQLYDEKADGATKSAPA